MPQVDPVVLQLKADVDGYNLKISEAQRLTDQKLGAIERKGFEMGQSLKNSFSLAKTAAFAFAGSVVVSQIFSAIKTSLDYASSLGETAQQLGVTSTALQEYRFAATQVGVSQEEMDQSLSQLTRRIGEAEGGTKAQALAFDRLGISVKGANGQILNAGDAIPMIADGLAKIESPAERAAILVDLFGRAGQKLEPLLAGGSSAVNQLRDAAHDLGGVLSEEQIQNADRTADKLAEVKMVLSAQIAGVVADNAGAIFTLARALEQVAGWAGPAARAFFQFKMAQGMAESAATVLSPFTSGDQKIAAIKQGKRFGDALLRGTPTDQTGSFRDYRAAPLPNSSSVKSPPGFALGGGSNLPDKPVHGGAGHRGGRGGGGDDPEQILRRYNDQLIGYTTQTISAQESTARSADERAELEMRTVEWARRRAISDIENNTKYDATQKQMLTQQVEALAQEERARVDFARKQQNERDAADLSEAEFQNSSDALKAQYDLTDSTKERRQIAQEMVELEYQHQRAVLDAIVASETASKSEVERARVARQGLDAGVSAKREAAARDHESPFQKYSRDLTTEAQNIGDAFENVAVRGIDRMNQGLAESYKKMLGLHGVLGDIVGDFIEIAIRQAEAGLFGGGGGGILGGITSLLGIGSKVIGGNTAGLESNFDKVLGHRAIGGPVSAGLYKVGENGPEIVRMGGGGLVIPNHDMIGGRGASSAPSVVQIHVVEGQLFESRVQTISGDVSVKVVRAAGPALVDASARETSARLRRPRL